MKRKSLAALAVMALSVSAGQSWAMSKKPPEPIPVESAMGECDQYTPLKQPFFGDLHVHTGLSLDALTVYTDTTPAAAYEFAKGGRMELPVNDGAPARFTQLERPLDFTSVTDHAEWLAETNICFDASNKTLAYFGPYCLAVRNARGIEGPIGNLTKMFSMSINAIPLIPFNYNVCGTHPELCAERDKSVWKDITDAADDAHDFSNKCSFTAFKGYEWTGTPLYSNLHRNVIFKTREVPDTAIDYFAASTPEKLWQKLDQECKTEEGCDVLAIPHNSNLAGGLMFKTETLWGRQYNKADALKRQEMEPLVEIVQAKGASECFNGQNVPYGSSDEACNFEQIVQDHICTGNEVEGESCTPLCSSQLVPLAGMLGKCVEPGDFVRGALRQGLAAKSELGANPFKFGFVGGTDTHNGAPGDVEEYGYEGSHGVTDATVAQRVSPSEGSALDAGSQTRYFNPGGLSVIWAEQNTRGALFDALRRKETHATSGTRIVMRMFGGFDLNNNMCQVGNFAEQGYRDGVPMGSDINGSGFSGSAPKFAVSAMMDVGTSAHPGTSLQRIQMIKAWQKDGQSFEKVFNIAGGDTGAGVDLNSCETTGSGHSNLCSVWQDPEFNKTDDALYYARVLENESCRFNKRQCNNELQSQGLTCDSLPADHELSGCCDGKVPDTIQERAWSSPIWYNAQ